MADQTQIPPTVALLALALSVGVVMAVLGSWAWLVVKKVDGQTFLPQGERRVVPWGPLSVLALIGAYLAISFLLGAGYAGLQWARHGKVGAIPLIDLLLIDALTKLLMVVLVPPILRRTSGAQLADLGLTTRELGKNLARGMWLCFLMLPVVYTVAFAASRVSSPQSHPMEKAIRQTQSPGMMIVAGLSAVVAAPIAEELLFRGVLLGWFWRIGLRRREEEAEPVLIIGDFPDQGDPFATALRAEPSPVVTVVEESPFAGRGGFDFRANVAVSFIFAGLHATAWPAPVPLFFLSLMLGEAYRRTGSLAAPIALHATFNGLSTIAMFLMAVGGVPRP